MSMRLVMPFIFLIVSMQSSAQFSVGAASAVINPQPGAFIAGHSQNRKFRGIHDDLFVKALVVSRKNDNLTLLTFDCIGLLYPQLLEIRKKAASLLKDTDFKAAHVVMSSTHTHAGPDVVGIWGPHILQSGVDSSYMQFLINRAAETIVKAWKGREWASADFSVTQHGEDWVYNISEPAETDRSVTILRFSTRDGKSLASLTNFACHPTFVDGVHDQVSADFIGGFYRRMDSVWGGTNMYLQGAIGGWVQPEHEEKSFQQAFYRGRQLADAVLESWPRKRKLQQQTVKFVSGSINLPVDNNNFRQLAAAGVIRRPITAVVESEIAAFRIGESVFATHPGETVPAMSLETKKMMNTGGPRFILGLGMDGLGYILKPAFFDSTRNIPHAKYLCSMSLGEKTWQEISVLLQKLLIELKDDEKSGSGIRQVTRAEKRRQTRR